MKFLFITLFFITIFVSTLSASGWTPLKLSFIPEVALFDKPTVKGLDIALCAAESSPDAFYDPPNFILGGIGLTTGRPRHNEKANGEISPNRNADIVPAV